jgi:acyl-[acyl-carrier-protein]-phospholipid O-acyltransferase/long-chain-fatty-acid--[acyl-carrier-protein] ligase
MGVFTAVVAMTTNYSTALVALALVGFGGGFMVVPLNAYLQEEPAADEKGRMIAVNNLMNSVAMMVAYVLLDLTHDVLHWTPRAIFAALAVAMLVGAVATVRIMPAFVMRFVLTHLVHLFFRLRVVGGENIPRSGPALIVANHVSYADAVLAGYATRRFIRFLIWKPLYETRFAKPFFDVLMAIPIDNGTPKVAIRALHAANNELKNGKLVGIFAEGQITRDGEVAPFERGYERILRGVDCPIIPVYIEGMWGHPLSRKGGEAFRSWNGWFRTRVTVHVGKPVSAGTPPEELRQIVIGTGKN